MVKLNQQNSIMHHSSSPYGHYSSQNGNHVGQPKNTVEDAHVEEKKSLDALSRFISKFCFVLMAFQFFIVFLL